MLKELIKRIAKELKENGVPYIIIGGQAVLLYREPRFTNDIDITLGFDTSHLNRIIEITKLLDLKILVNNPSEFVAQTMVLPTLDNESGYFRVDFIFSTTEFEQNAIKRANIIYLDGIEVSYCSLEDLIIFKIFAGRQRDLEDIKYMLIKNPVYDKNYVEQNLIELGKSIDKDLLSTFRATIEKSSNVY